MAKLAIFTFIIVLSLTISSSLVYGATSSSRFNWLEFCRSPLIDFAVTEPCETLATRDGYTLTREGERVVGCFLGGGLLVPADPSGTALMTANSISQKAGLCADIGAPLGNQKELANIFNGLSGR